ncbi:transcription termination factor NusA [Candidatus Roizmanbacteria bacterium]|nr:transcription termination factor NusA [Candidatus Roizmanbacteria bacterium]
MPAIVRTEFALALNQVATERGIDVTVVIETIKSAILAAYYKDYGLERVEEEGQKEFVVEIDANTGEAKVLKDGKDVTPPGFGRIAAQTAKQVILQKIREAEKNAILSDYASRVGTIVSGMILRFDGPAIIVDIGRAQGVMPPPEQVRTEQYRVNQRLTFYIKEIRDGRRGSEIVLSRGDARLVAGLFQREVPEVANKSVEMRVIAREAGSRTKIAVASTQPGVDPVGSCVGQKGVRVQAVINELGQDEKIDVIQWSDNQVQFITSALAPAKDLTVTINEKEKQALVMIPEEYLSLAIGRNGQNVRLASKLTGYTIDIRQKGMPLEEDGTIKKTQKKTETNIFSTLGVSKTIMSTLSEQFKSIEGLTKATDKEILAIPGVGKKTLATIKTALEKKHGA